MTFVWRKRRNRLGRAGGVWLAVCHTRGIRYWRPQCAALTCREELPNMFDEGIDVKNN